MEMERSTSKLDALKNYLYVSLRNYIPYSWKKTAISIGLATVIGLTGATVACIPKDENPPVIQNYQASEPTVESENITIYSKNSVQGYAQDKDIDIYIPQLLYLESDGILSNNEKAFIDLLPEMNKTFAEWVVKNKFTFEDGEIKELELELLKYPANQNYIQQLFDQYISDVNKINPELGMELKRLPDLENMEKVDFGLDGIKKLEGLEDVVVLADNPKYKSVFESMLNEGIKGKRKVCTPVEALYSIACFNEFNGNSNPLENYSLENIIREFWIYRGDIWEDFDKATDRLNSLNILALYMLDNVWQEPYNGQKKTIEEVFESKRANCVDQSRFAAYCMMKNGTKIDTSLTGTNTSCILAVLWKSPVMNYGGHVVFLYKKDNSFYFIDDGYINPRKRLYGPFNTLEDVTKAVDYSGIGVRGRTCFNLNDVR